MSPLRSIFGICVLFAGMVCAGCSNQPSHIANPLYSADRVPAPGTRALAPGTAQPYYSGDPLPVMPSSPVAPPGQSSTTPGAGDKLLDWSSPTIADVELPVGNRPPQPTGFAANTSLPPANTTCSWDAPLQVPTASQQVLPVGWSDAPATSPPPRVRMPQSQGSALAIPPPTAIPDEPLPASDGFRARGSRPAPY
jgi:hypothetical protein